MPELRIISKPHGSDHNWQLIGHLYGRSAVIAEGSLYAMLHKRRELETER